MHSEIQRGVMDFLLNTGGDSLDGQSLQSHNIYRLTPYILKEVRPTASGGASPEDVVDTIARHVGNILRHANVGLPVRPPEKLERHRIGSVSEQQKKGIDRP